MMISITVQFAFTSTRSYFLICSRVLALWSSNVVKTAQSTSSLSRMFTWCPCIVQRLRFALFYHYYHCCCFFLFSLFHIFHLTLLAFRGRQRKNVIVQRHMLLTVAMTINTVNPDRNPETNHSTVKHGWDLAGFIVTDLDPR